MSSLINNTGNKLGSFVFCNSSGNKIYNCFAGATISSIAGPTMVHKNASEDLTVSVAVNRAALNLNGQNYEIVL